METSNRKTLGIILVVVVVALVAALFGKRRRPPVTPETPVTSVEPARPAPLTPSVKKPAIPRTQTLPDPVKVNYEFINKTNSTVPIAGVIGFGESFGVINYAYTSKIQPGETVQKVASFRSLPVTHVTAKAQIGTGPEVTCGHASFKNTDLPYPTVILTYTDAVTAEGPTCTLTLQ